MEDTTTDSTSEPQVHFRRGKKRKFYRQRDGDLPDASGDVVNNEATQHNRTAPAAIDEHTRTERVEPPDNAEDALAVAEALRLRSARRAKLGGVSFQAGHSSGIPSKSGDETSLVLRQDGGDSGKTSDPLVGGITKRFAAQTGLVGELVNKHM